MVRRTAFLLLMCFCAAVWGDTVGVVCPAELSEALEPWAEYRRAQGHEILVGESPHDIADELSNRHATGGRISVLLVGDGRRVGVPPALAPARVIWRFGPERLIPTDAPYGDLDGDGLVDASVARLPFITKSELAAYVRRVVRREQQPTGWADLRLQIAAGEGGFSPVIDAAIEATARRLIGGLAPEELTLSLRHATDPPLAEPTGPPGGVWVWLGHGLRDRLPGVASNRLVASSGRADVAVLLACYAGDTRAHGKCVAEQLLSDESGPLAVIASTGVSMPYGNARLGAELLLAVGSTPARTWGSTLLEAKRASLLEPGTPDLEAIDSLALALGGSDLKAERKDHVGLYHFFGDPLLKPRATLAMQITASHGDGVLTVRGRSPIAGRLTVETVGGATRSKARVASACGIAANEDFKVELRPNSRATSVRLRAGVTGPDGLAVGVASARWPTQAHSSVATAESSPRGAEAGLSGASF